MLLRFKCAGNQDLALQLEPCLPRLLSSPQARGARSTDSGLSAGILAAGPDHQAYSFSVFAPDLKADPQQCADPLIRLLSGRDQFVKYVAERCPLACRRSGRAMTARAELASQ